jgi:hypothetical protein
MGLTQTFIGIILIIAGAFLPIDILYKIIIILIGGILAGVFGFLLAIVIIIVIYFKIFPF